MFLVLIYLAFISLGLPDSVVGSAWPLMSHVLGIPIDYLSYLTMTVALGTVISSLNSVWFIDRYGTGKVTLFSVSLTAIGLLGISLSSSLMGLIISAIPLGLGAGAVDTGLNDFVAQHFKALHMNWLHAFWGIGAMSGPLIFAAYTSAGATWQSSFWTIFIIQIGLILALFFSLPHWKKFQSDSSPTQTATTKTYSLSDRLKIPGVQYALLSFFLYAALENTINVWGATYLVERLQLPPEKASVWLSLFFLGIIIGRITSGFLSLRVNGHRLLALGCILIALGVGSIALAVYPLVGLGLIGTGLAPIFPTLLHLTPNHFGSNNSQAVMGLQMTANYVAVTILPLIYGQLFKHFGFHLFPWLLLLAIMGLSISIWQLSQLRHH